HPVAISRKRATLDGRPGIPEDRHGAVIYERALPRLFGDRVISHIGNVPDEQTVADPGGAAGQQVNRRPGALRPVSEKLNVLDQTRVLVESSCRTGMPGAE